MLAWIVFFQKAPPVWESNSRHRRGYSGGHVLSRLCCVTQYEVHGSLRCQAPLHPDNSKYSTLAAGGEGMVGP